MSLVEQRRLSAGGLAVAGGLLMVASGYASRGFLYKALGFAQPRIPDFLTGAAASAAALAIASLEVIIALGGVTVAIGGVAILAAHTTTGRTLVYLGGGAGFLGVLVSFGYTAYRLGGVGPTLAYLPYWVGLVLAVAGRRLARGS